MNANLLLLHGALGCKDQFDPLAKILEDHFNLHLLNFEGHGGEHSDIHFSIDLFAGKTSDFIKENKIEGTNVFGYSMGGYVALKLALNQPGTINKIITLGTKFQWDETTAEKEIKMLNPENIELKVPQFAAELKRRHYPEDWKIVMKKTAGMMHALGNGQAMKLSDFK